MTIHELLVRGWALEKGFISEGDYISKRLFRELSALYYSDPQNQARIIEREVA